MKKIIPAITKVEITVRAIAAIYNAKKVIHTKPSDAKRRMSAINFLKDCKACEQK